MNENTWKIIPEGTIRIDFSGCRYVDEIHEKLKESFGFPEDYGANWSAFWDYLDDFCGDRESVTTVVVLGMELLRDDLRDYTEKMIEIMHRAEQMYPKVHFVFKNN